MAYVIEIRLETDQKPLMKMSADTIDDDCIETLTDAVRFIREWRDRQEAAPVAAVRKAHLRPETDAKAEG